MNAIDHLEVIALMDNVSDPFTELHPNLRWNESQYMVEVLNKKSYCGEDFCRACLGLSLLIKFSFNDETKTVLFDAGPDKDLVVDNAKRMQIDLTQIDAVVLSHGHFDHYAGLISVLDAVGKKDLLVYVHPELFAPRAFDEGTGTLYPCSYNLTQEEVEKHGGKVIASQDPLVIFQDHLLISGEVERVTAYETGSPGECREINGQWEDASLVIDERVLILNLKGQGLCVFTACGHTGVINAVKHAQKITGINKVHLVMGGFHLAPASVANRIKLTLDDFAQINPDYIATGHCTGAKAQGQLTERFRDKHMPYGVGTVLRLLSRERKERFTVLD